MHVWSYSERGCDSRCKIPSISFAVIEHLLIEGLPQFLMTGLLLLYQLQLGVCLSPQLTSHASNRPSTYKSRCQGFAGSPANSCKSLTLAVSLELRYRSQLWCRLYRLISTPRLAITLATLTGCGLICLANTRLHRVIA